MVVGLPSLTDQNSHAYTFAGQFTEQFLPDTLSTLTSVLTSHTVNNKSAPRVAKIQLLDLESIPSVRHL